MPSKSKAQARFMHQVQSCKMDDHKRCEGAVKAAANSMSMKQVKDFTKGKVKGLPEKVKAKK